MKPVVNHYSPIAVVVAAIVVFAVGYRWGGGSAQDEAQGIRFQVAGASMAPTFIEGQVCHSSSLTMRPEIGDVVAIEWAGRRRLKRVAALGGDVVDVVDGRLMVNRRRLEDIIADRNPSDFVPPALVLVKSDSDDWTGTEGVSGWILYGHRNPYQSGRITPVTDDYPINDSVRRKLNDVDRLAVEIRKSDPQSPGKVVSPIRVAFFDNRHRLVASKIRSGLARYRDAGTLEQSDAGWSSELVGEMDASHPIALQISKRDSQHYSLRVFREIEYRDDRPSGNVSYPLRVPDQEVFVVGDNVPVSVDSRELGPLPLSALIGRVNSRNSIGSDR